MKIPALQLLFVLMLCTVGVAAQNDTIIDLPGKDLYVPHDLRNMDLNDTTSRWCLQRSSVTPDIIIMWEKGFGSSLASPPPLEGHDMSVNLAVLKRQLQRFYDDFGTRMCFKSAGSNAERFRMMVMINYSLEGTAYGGTYDNFIGALWVSPSRIKDSTMNCMAHELGHSFQLQIMADNKGEGWGGSGFYEMTSQWMLWHENRDWLTSENYHFAEYKKNTHKAFIDVSNIYRAPYVLEYWSEKRGIPVIAELYRNSPPTEDPAMTYKRLFNLTQAAFNDEMFEAARRMVNLDFYFAYDLTRKHAARWEQPTEKNFGLQDFLKVPDNKTPEDYGFNIIPVTNWSAGQKLTLIFRGKSKIGFEGWRYGFVTIDKKGTAHYSDIGRRNEGRLKYRIAYDTKQVFLVVMGAPTLHMKTDGTTRLFPYEFKLK